METAEISTESQQSAIPPETPASGAPAAEPNAGVNGQELQRENSRLGRKFKQLEEQLGSVQNTFQDTVSRLEQLIARGNGTPNDAMPDIVSTADDVIRVVNANKIKEQQAEQVERNKYQQNYRFQLSKLGENETHHESIVDTMLRHEEFNRIHTGDPNVDVQLNYARAKVSVLERLNGQPPPPAGTAPSALGVTGKSATSHKAPIKLSPDAQRYAERMGMNAEDVSKALGEEQ